MAAHHPSPPANMQLHHAAHNGPVPPGMPQQQPNWQPPPAPTPMQQLTAMNEQVWLQIGSLAELLGNLDEAMGAYEHVLRTNPRSIPAMNAISSILRAQEQFAKAVEYLQNILKFDQNNGDVWGSLGHCFLMMDDLQQAYSAYQQALYHLRDPKEPKLWYGIGILYDRYGSLEHAEEAFSQVMRMQPDFEKANEIYFRLGIIYKQQQKYQQSLECFRYIVSVPPTPLTEEDIWFQIGHVHEQQKDYDNAKIAYKRVLDRDPKHAKVLQQLGWLHHQQSTAFQSQEQAIEYLEQSVGSDQSDAQSWYLLGRCYMSQQKYPKAYEAYQQAVYRDGRNPTFWCSIGVLYYQINQYRDALDAYSRAIRLNPYISEVWYDLGTLYESCNNQINDALDAYQRAAELDPNNVHIKARLQLLRSGQAGGGMQGQAAAPLPQDVHPQAYQASGTVGPPGPQWGNSAPQAQVQGPPAANGWGSRLAEINPPPQPPNPYEQQRPADRGPIPPAPRIPSPRQEQQMRPYPGADARQPLDTRQPLPPRPRSPPRAPIDMRDGPRDPRDARDARDPRDPRDPRDLRDPRDARDPRDVRDPRDPREFKQEFKDPRADPRAAEPQPRDPRDMRDPRDPREGPRDPRDARDHHPLGPYPGPGAGAGSGPQPPPPAHAQQPQGPPSQPQRVANINYVPPPLGPPSVLPPAPTGINGAGPGPLPPFGRGNSPRSEVRPIMSATMASPKTSYPNQPPYAHHAEIPDRSGIEGGAPPPASALAAAEATSSTDRGDNRPPSVGPKRMREWEDEPSVKKPASDENRARLEDMHHRRPSTPPRDREQFHRSSSEARRVEDQRRIEEQRLVEEQRHADFERREADQRRLEAGRAAEQRAAEQRRANENYHPSEAAHHPPTHGMQGHLPAMQQDSRPPPPHTYEAGPPPPLSQQATPIKETPIDERDRQQLPASQTPSLAQRLDQPPPLPAPSPSQPAQPAPMSEPERAARKMDIEENYDDEGEEDKKGGIVSTQASGPPSASGDPKTTSPTGVNGHSANGLPNGQPKVESNL